ncbi:hypothetical protein J3R83DRAFT_2964, partial [Lanmaoa asiatica]
LSRCHGHASPMMLPLASDDQKAHTFKVSLTVYSLLKKKTSWKVSTLKEEKSMKVKELLFTVDDDNYIEFLTSLLEKYGWEQYKVSQQHCFPFEYIPPKVK